MASVSADVPVMCPKCKVHLACNDCGGTGKAASVINSQSPGSTDKDDAPVSADKCAACEGTGNCAACQKGESVD